MRLSDKKEDQNGPRNPADLIRSDFWFNDGNIVIVAGSAAFKVHRGQLERHSEVFHGLFSIPQSAEDELFEGCLCVELHDHPSDIFYFFKALYDGLYFKHPRSNDFAAVAAVLRLSTKYLVDSLRQRCLARLNKDWPITLAMWDIRERGSTDSSGRYVPRESYPHPILVLELALEMGLPNLLPAAFYDLCRYKPSNIMDGTVSPSLAIDNFCGKTNSSSNRPVVLSRELLCRVFRGRESAQRFVADFIAKELQSRQPSANCVNEQNPTVEGAIRPCHDSFYFIMLNVLRSVGGIACGRDADPLFTLVQATDMLSRTDFSDGQRQCGLRVCYPCKLDFAASTAKAREEAWQLLPLWFGLVDTEMKEVPDLERNVEILD